ncbi:HAD-like domain-containing protein, partial [Pavlovales sp. CCMP2436]
MHPALMIASLAHARPALAARAVGRVGLARMSVLVSADGSPAAPLARIPRVVFTDCDGTMLGPDHRLSDRTRAALRALTHAGVRVVPATGRGRSGSWIEHVLSEPALMNGFPGIFLNGCQNYDELEVEHTVCLTPLAARAAVAFGDSRRDLEVTTVVYVRGEALFDVDHPLIAKLAAVGDSPLRRVTSLAAELECDELASVCAKVLMLYEDDEITASSLRAAVEPAIGEWSGAELTRALRWCLEVKPQGTCKATAAAALLARWGLQPEDALALGDGENDISLLHLCGASVAMGNGCAQAKSVAMYLAPSNAHDGWAQAVETLVLRALEDTGRVAEGAQPDRSDAAAR